MQWCENVKYGLSLFCVSVSLFKGSKSIQSLYTHTSPKNLLFSYSSPTFQVKSLITMPTACHKKKKHNKDEVTIYIYISTATRDSKAGRRYCWRCWLYHLNDKFLLLFSGKDCGASLESALIPGSTCTFGIPIVIMVLRKNNGWWCRFVW